MFPLSSSDVLQTVWHSVYVCSCFRGWTLFGVLALLPEGSSVCQLHLWKLLCIITFFTRLCLYKGSKHSAVILKVFLIKFLIYHVKYYFAQMTVTCQAHLESELIFVKASLHLCLRARVHGTLLGKMSEQTQKWPRRLVSQTPSYIVV